MFREISQTALDLLADGAARPEQAVEVLLAVELPELGEAGVGEGGAAGGALEAVLVQGAVSHPQHVLVFYLSVALCTDLHIRHCLQLQAPSTAAGLQYSCSCSALLLVSLLLLARVRSLRVLTVEWPPSAAPPPAPARPATRPPHSEHGARPALSAAAARPPRCQLIGVRSRRGLGAELGAEQPLTDSGSPVAAKSINFSTNEGRPAPARPMGGGLTTRTPRHR